jgi:hypothetical protein
MLLTREEIEKDPRPCPGGLGCECCRPDCDCGCRDDCPRFRYMLRMEKAAEAAEETT